MKMLFSFLKENNFMIEWYFLGVSHQQKSGPTQVQPPIIMVNSETSSTQHGNEGTKKQSKFILHKVGSVNC